MCFGLSEPAEPRNSQSARSPAISQIVTELDVRDLYQHVSGAGDVDLKPKLRGREHFWNRVKPHRAHYSKTPYEVLKAS